MQSQSRPDGPQRILAAVQAFAVATASEAEPDLYLPLTFLLSQVRQSLKMDVVFVSRYVDRKGVFEVVSADGEAVRGMPPGLSYPPLDSYCQRVIDGRLPPLIADTTTLPELAELAITRRLHIKAYLSAPVVLPNGQVFGTVCCVSHHTRPDLREADVEALFAVARAVAASVERHGSIRFASWTTPAP